MIEYSYSLFENAVCLLEGYMSLSDWFISKGIEQLIDEEIFDSLHSRGIQNRHSRGIQNRESQVNTARRDMPCFFSDGLSEDVFEAIAQYVCSLQ